MSDVSLTVPAGAEYLRLVRLAAADCGARADLSIEDIEDLRIAVDELAYALMGDNPSDARLNLRYTAAPGVVEIEGSCAADGGALAVSDLSRTIIGGSVTEYAIAHEEGVRRFRLVKRTRA
jgi:serine/threonine-protein kinase RsbW